MIRVALHTGEAPPRMSRRTFTRTLRATWKDYPVPSAVLLAIILIYVVLVVARPAKIFPAAGLLALFTWFVFRAPNVCGAINRDGNRCRNNAKGLLRGCHLIDHKRQNLVQRLRATTSWATPHLRDTAKGTIEILGALGSLVGGIYGFLGYINR